jgi:hypothetical protein
MVCNLLKGICFSRNGPPPLRDDARSCVSIFYRV